MTHVTLLTKSHCHLCDQAKELLFQIGQDFPLQVDIVSTESAEGAALALRKGILFPPGVLLDGQPFAYGRLSEGKLRRRLEQLFGGSH
jgi:glutaredoxin